MNISIQELEVILKSKAINIDSMTPISGFSIDTRTIRKNEVFFALRGDNYDGHSFANDAIKNGASLIISEKKLNTLPYISVGDTMTALKNIAKFYIKKINPITIGITGTNGKTTVTNMTTAILATCMKTSSTYKNFNNQIGLPLSILSADEDDKALVLEMGASKVGDISELVKIANPSIVALLNVSPAHIDSFKNLENIVKTKEEILSYKGYLKTVVLDSDEDNFKRWVLKSKKNNIITVSINHPADYCITNINDNKICIKTPYDSIENLQISDSESHTLKNILFSIALSYMAGARASNVIVGLDNIRDIDGRFSIKNGLNGSKIIDSTYNANPQSFISAINSLKRLGNNSWLIMGEMGELGEDSELYHKQVVRYAYDMGIKKLFVIGRHSDAMLNEFGDNSYSFKSIDKLVNFIKPQLSDNVNILVKASRFMRFEVIVEALLKGEH
ncbi:MAG: UDP-N-acetylmuramoyl-tripeptide--D-alanyl-D-alanine ligase [Gammaproteobacteria bacterium]|jgi:UDP-N-acetylmuramoyl-tripeptide--D-alanyl-D-alanine ligase|nr:UDP-N-acetylmuramoyl-tripeptide--D-alanyl-D-alanine ligase [Gammaproteobacteria bacterium]MBT4462732.1 UDP-N-acetylmuramoyl-tripeptide--D-alanyl-D-alanine ligase [Gammaproteobacteria bacterium]MBT4654392.1 UDP-N-acetylmuramoyl-tripeptide--D-alanyl-D-alanine ligase [Gammaproteobacteria bacterium]MBT5116309.1 UDP-N-acetylmuramoyl-tripeptide--D-alanyl-D-alanine ligase [Gammaproteobacteria bacterium]MBT5761859.1 UDP-N-acetylmuramoyl-tripeptide--D-alanyl-D-alanine ligase [Gammaproteobacteria bact